MADSPNWVDVSYTKAQISSGHAEIRMEVNPLQLAEDISDCCTPDFRVSLVRRLFQLDPALEAEITGEAGK